MKKLNMVRYIRFLIVGGIGVIINYFVYMPFRNKITFNISFDFWSYPILLFFDLMWFIGIAVSATSNYILNEWWTFNNDKSS